jgi:5'(3')-deoxyribonucleotidase
MTKPLTILVDMDGIVTNFLDAWIDALNAKFNRGLTIADVTDWDISKSDKLKGIPSGKVYRYIHQPMFFYDLKPLPGAIDSLKALVGFGHTVKFLSIPTNPLCAYEKLLWVDKYMPFIGHRSTILCADKELVAGDVFIDDKSANCLDYQNAHPKARVYSIGYPYNAGLASHPLVRVMGRYDDTKAAWAQIVQDIRDYQNA